MSLRPLRVALLVLGVVLLVVIESVAAFADIRPTTRYWLALAAAGTVAALTLPQAPPTRPPAERRKRRSPAVAALGRWLIRLLWLGRCALHAYATFLFTTGLAATAFQTRTAVLVGTAQLLTLLLKAASHIAGFVVYWTFLRGWKLVRYLLGVAVAVLLAGYGGLIVDVVEAVVPWLPVRTYEVLRGWGVWAWAAVTLAVLSYPVILVVSFLARWAVERAAARVLGADNAVSSWLDRHLPNRFVLTTTGYVLPLRRRERRRLMRYEQPLGRDEEQALADRVADVLSAHLVPRWASFALSYRAAGRHEEVVAMLGWWGPRDERGTSRGEHQEWEVVGFAELDSLRRLRAAGYRAGMGTPFEWVLAFDTARTYRDDEHPVPPRGRARWEPSRRHGEPYWFRPPAPEDYREDLRRFPIVPRMRPHWLRERLRTDAPDRMGDTSRSLLLCWRRNAYVDRDDVEMVINESLGEDGRVFGRGAAPGVVSLTIEVYDREIATRVLHRLDRLASEMQLLAGAFWKWEHTGTEIPVGHAPTQ